jgi:hypothetical protein
MEFTNWFRIIFYPYILKAKVVAKIFDKDKSGTALITLKAGQVMIRTIKPINFKVKLKYFSFYYSYGVSLNFNFFIGIAKIKAKKNTVIPPPEVMAFIPNLLIRVPNYYMTQFSAKAKIYIIAKTKI